MFPRLVPRKILTILGMFCGSLFLIAPSVRAQTQGLDDCYANFDARHDICVDSFIDCFLNGPPPGHTSCADDYDNCELDNATKLHNCLFSADYPGSAPEYQYRTQCIRDCDNLYWDCEDDGGRSTSTFNQCYEYTGYGDLDVCCDNERSLCIRYSCS